MKAFLWILAALVGWEVYRVAFHFADPESVPSPLGAAVRAWNAAFPRKVNP